MTVTVGRGEDVNSGHRSERLREYSAALQALSAEMSAAICAMKNNDLRELEARVERQESICATLVVATAALPGLLHNGARDDIPERSEVAEAWRNLRERHADLMDQCRLYSAVLRHSSKSVALLAALCRSYNGYEPVASVCSSPSSLSCEI